MPATRPPRVILLRRVQVGPFPGVLKVDGHGQVDRVDEPLGQMSRPIGPVEAELPRRSARNGSGPTPS